MVIVVLGWRNLAQPVKRAIGLLGITSVVLVIAEDIQYYNILRNFGVQGRHITPLLVGIPILGARFLRISRRSNGVLIAIWCFTAIGSGLAALRRYSVGVVGDNALDMFTDPVWSPPLGMIWSIMLLIVVTCCAGLVVMSVERRKVVGSADQ